MVWRKAADLIVLCAQPLLIFAINPDQALTTQSAVYSVCTFINSGISHHFQVVQP